VCPRCNKREKEVGKSNCRICLDKLAGYQIKRRRGVICGKCGNSKSRGKGLCTLCLDGDSKRKMVEYRQRKEDKVCVKCGKKCYQTFEQCFECLERRVQRNKDLKVEVFKNYGNECICCGEDHIDFLNIDHLNNDGSEHRKIIGKGNLYTWLKKSGFPAGFQCLCTNCNHGKRINNGWCPKHSNLLLPKELQPAQLLYPERSQSRIKKKREVFSKYGNACRCCGETQFEFLTLDHIYDDGKQHREQVSGCMYTWAANNDFPGMLQILCMGCNLAKEIGHGACRKHNNYLKGNFARRVEG
jgi:hypothetical protein